MNQSNRLVHYVTSCSWTALAFLAFMNIYHAPAVCPRCSRADNWYIQLPKKQAIAKSGSQAYFWCRHPKLDVDPPPAAPEPGRRLKKKLKICSAKRQWMKKKQGDMPFADENLPKIQPADLVKVLWNFSQMLPIEYSVWETGVSKDSVGWIYYMLRDTLGAYMAKIGADRKMGGPGRVVCLDETFFCKRPKNKGGFKGKPRLSHQTIMMGGVELDKAGKGRKCTGRAFLVLIHNRTAETFRKVIEDHVADGTTIWTDGHASYKWLDNDERFEHDAVIHRKGQFMKKNEEGIKVSTNAIEGLFGRTKRMMRRVNAKVPTKQAYGLYMAEFLWRTRFLKQEAGKPGWRDRAFVELLRAIRVIHKPKSHDCGNWSPAQDPAWSEHVAEWTSLLNDAKAPKPKRKRGRKRARAPLLAIQDVPAVPNADSPDQAAQKIQEPQEPERVRFTVEDESGSEDDLQLLLQELRERDDQQQKEEEEEYDEDENSDDEDVWNEEADDIERDMVCDFELTGGQLKRRIPILVN